MKTTLCNKKVLLLILTSFSSFSLFAQPGGSSGPRQLTEDDIKIRVERLAETLELTEKQEEQLLKYELDEFNSRQDMFAHYSGDREAMRAYRMNMREKRDEVYATILTEKQMAEWVALREERMNARQQKANSDSTKRNRGRGR